MNDWDRDIERVLTGLKTLEAPEGLQRRVLVAMENRVSKPARVGWLPPVGAFALAGIVVALAVVATARKGSSPVAVGSKQAPVRATGTQLAGARPQPVAPLARSARVQRQTWAGAVAAEPESLEVSEMLAPSMLPPPMPLTEQERLLLRVAHAGDPQEMAMLNPGLEEAQNARERAELERMLRQPSAYVAAPVAPAIEANSVSALPTLEQTQIELHTATSQGPDEPQRTIGTQPTAEQPSKGEKE